MALAKKGMQKINFIHMTKNFYLAFIQKKKVVKISYTSKHIHNVVALVVCGALK